MLAIMNELGLINFLYKKPKVKIKDFSLKLSELQYKGFEEDKKNFKNDISLVLKDIDSAKKQIS